MMNNNPYREKMPSLHDIQPDIAKTIKTNPDLQNAEIEKGEVIIKPDLSGVYLGSGKKHSGGGIKTYLEPNSFVYSNDKSLSLDETDYKLFELKEGPNYKKKDNTPAKALLRSFKPEEYNGLINKLTDKNSDEITKRTAELMLTKHLDTLGKVAFIQEGKKDYPQGIPDFAQSATPVYATEVKTEIKEQPQYMKKGGYTLPEYKLGDYTDPYRRSNTPQGRTTPTGESSLYDRGPEYLKSWESLIPGISSMDNMKAQSLIYDYMLKNDPDKVKDMWGQYGLTNKGLKNPALAGLSNKGKFDPNSINPEILSKLKPAYTDNYFGARQLDPPMKGELPPVTVKYTRPKPNVQVPNNPAPGYPGLPNTPDGTEDINWKFNPYQKANLALDALQWAGTRQEFPYRSQIQSSLVELERLNPQSALNQITNSTTQAYQANRALNPYIAGANNAQTFGRSLDAQNQVQSQYDNQNVQIGNQQNILNAQSQDQDLQFNVLADQRYYNQTVEGRKNFDNLKQFGLNNLRNNFNSYVSQNQALAYNMAQTPYAPFKYDFETGQFHLTGNRSILDASGTQGADAVSDQIDYIKNSSASEDAKLKALSEIWKSKTLAPYLLQHKTGGIQNPYKKKKK